MKMQEIIIIAKEKNVPYKIGMSKSDLIRAIQTKEGYRACFRIQESCQEKKCLWLDDCVPAGMRFS